MEQRKDALYEIDKQKIENRSDFIIGINYGKAVNLLHFELPVAYSTRGAGWACNYYIVDDTLISIGYSPLKSKGTNATDDMITYYDNQAKDIILQGKYSDYVEKLQKMKSLLSDFVSDAKGLTHYYEQQMELGEER